MENCNILERYKLFGVGRRKLNDEIFGSDKPPPRLGVYDMDDEYLCHEIVKTTCTVPGCHFIAESLLEFENHYNCSHRYTCAQCKKIMPSPHLLDLHVQENHDSFFAVMAERKPSYCCYIEECNEKFKTPDERMDHCVKNHKLPKDFRFEQKVKNRKKQNAKTKKFEESMDLDTVNERKDKKFVLANSKTKTFSAYTGRKFTNNNKSDTPKEVDMDNVMQDLKESLPQ